MAYDGTLTFGTAINMKGFLEDIKKLTETITKNKDLQNALNSALQDFDAGKQLEQVVSGLTGSNADLAQSLETVQAAVAGTSYSFSTAAQAVQSFVTKGMNVDSAAEIIKRWGDAVAFYAGGSNEAFSSVLKTLGKMQDSTTVAKTQVDELVAAGIPAFAAYADAIGSTADEVKAAMGRGEVKTADFLRVMNSTILLGTTNFPALGGTAKNTSATWSGAVTAMRNSIAQGMAEVISAIDDANTQMGRATISESIEKIGDTAGNIFGSMASLIVPVVENFDLIATAVGVAGTSFLAYQVLVQKTTVLNAAFTAAQQLLTTAFMSSSAALYGCNAAAVAASLGVSIFNGVLKICNTLSEQNKIALIITGITIAVTTVSALFKKLTAVSQEFQKNEAAVEDAAQAYEDFSNSVNEAQQSFDRNFSSLKDQQTQTQKLAARLKELTKDEATANANQEELAQTIALLNSQVGSLNLSYDEQTGTLSRSADEVKNYIEAQQKQEDANLILERHNELLREQAENDRLLAESKTRLADLEKQKQTGTNPFENYDNLIADEIETQEGYQQKKAEIAADIENLNAGQAASEAAAAQAVIDAAEAKAAAEAESAQRRTDSITSFAEASTNMFEAINTESDVSAEKMLENLQHNKDAMENYQTNLTKLRDRFKELKIDDAVIDQFANMGTEGMAYIQALADGSDDVLIGIVETIPENIEAGNAAGERAWQEGYAKMYDGGMGAAEAGTEGYTDGAATLPDAATTTITETKEATDAAVENAGFDDDGKKIQTKTADGVEENADELSEAVTDSITSAHTAAADAVEHTPFASIGEAIVRAIAAGVGANWSILNDAVTTLIENCAIAGGGKRVYGKSDQKNPASKPRAVGVEWAPHPWVAMGLVSEELMNAKIPNAAEVVAQMQAGVAMNQARVAAEGAPRAMHHIYTAQLAAAPATSTAKEGGMKVGAINVAIDAKNVKEFNDVVKIAQRAVMSYRQGYVDH